jgi:hypothetical protein
MVGVFEFNQRLDKLFLNVLLLEHGWLEIG